MTSALHGSNHNNLRLLASAMIDGTATDDQQEQLNALLRTDAAARDEYLSLLDMHALLATELPSPPPPLTQGQSTTKMSTRQRWRIGVLVPAVVACVSIAVLSFLSGEPEVNESVVDTNTSFLVVAQATDAVWEPGQYQAAGDRIGRKVLKLTAGFVRLEFDSGVEITLQGPAELEVLDREHMRLQSGLLTATVPRGAEGFTVDTPTAEVVDLGTSFGIDLREDGFSSVAVFDGEVEVTSSDSTATRLLTEGESVRVGEDQRIESISFEPERFEKLWPVSSGIAGSTDVFRFIPPWPKRIQFVQSDHDIFVASEGHAVELVKPLRVNISEPGTCARVADLTPRELESGLAVRSYILHFSPTENLRPRRAARVSGSITFDHPVLGMIVQHDELMASMRRFARRAAGEQQQRRQLELTGTITGDRVSLSEDRRTVTLDVIAPRRTSDLVRVIVDGDRSLAATSGRDKE